jgi:hypothetical protein
VSNAQPKFKIEEKLLQPHHVIHPQIKENKILRIQSRRRY